MLEHSNSSCVSRRWEEYTFWKEQNVMLVSLFLCFAHFTHIMYYSLLPALCASHSTMCSDCSFLPSYLFLHSPSILISFDCCCCCREKEEPRSLHTANDSHCDVLVTVSSLFSRTCFLRQENRYSVITHTTNVL